MAWHRVLRTSGADERLMWAARYAVEQLEARWLLASVTVSTLADVSNGTTSSIANLIANPGPDGISYREALTAANNTVGADDISFSVGGTINFVSSLPSVSGTTSIIASASGTPTIEFNGASAGVAGVGLNITATGCVVRGLAINRFAREGVVISGANNVIAGCYIGTNLAGTVDLGNTLVGIAVSNSSGNRIGGYTPQDRNVISGNNIHGINVLNSPFTKIVGNFIGTTFDGNSPLGNSGNGVAIDRSADCIVGGDDDDDGTLDNIVNARNVVSGNLSIGVGVGGSTALRNVVQGNYIGTNQAGTQAVPNAFGIILSTFGGDGTPVSQAIVGGTTAGAGNVISGNNFVGLRFFSGAHHNTVRGNFIGTTASGASPLPNGGSSTNSVVGYGIQLDSSATNNTIGGDDDDDLVADGIVKSRNVISGNFRGGIKIESTSTLNPIQGNYIGLNSDGTAQVRNTGPGIVVEAANHNTIGGSTPGAGNVISGNLGAGVDLRSGSSFIEILGNRIGTNAAGTAAVQNNGAGVLINASANNLVGSPTIVLGTGSANVISGNAGAGVHLLGAGSHGNGIYANFIGTNASGTAAIPNTGDGVLLEDAPNNLIGDEDSDSSGTTFQLRNLISGNALNGVHLKGPGTTNVEIAANRIGTNITGNQAVANTRAGVFIDDAPNNKVIEGNVISGNTQSGIEISGILASGNIVRSSVIGLNAAGTTAVPNGFHGIAVNGAPDTQIGGSTAAPGTDFGNVISANTGSGISLNNTSGALIWGNAIGTAADGVTDRGNGAYGVRINNSFDNRIGGTVNSFGNIIAFNGVSFGVAGHGICVISGTWNQIRGNSIFSNRGRGIDLGSDSFTPNDDLDFDDGANQLLNYPFVRSVDFIGGGMKTITFEYHGLPTFQIDFEFFSVPEPDPSGFGEGKALLSSQTQTQTVDDDGVARVSVTVPSNLLVSATATDPFFNTSEFSMVDTDADGLADAWETGGIDVNEDGVKDHFYAGASPTKKDLFVEADAMIGHNPIASALDDVVAAFANAPAASVDNPDGSAGIALHVQGGGDWDIPAAPWHETDPDSDYVKGFERAKAAYFGSPLDRLVPNWNFTRLARLMTYRYCVFADRLQDKAGKDTGTGGITEDFPSNDFFIALGAWETGGNRDVQASTFMHELGHSLGLQHGGGDSDNNKPNYYSVMNYLWGVGPAGALSSSWTLDYSRAAMPDIDEDGVNEAAGFGGDELKSTLIGPRYRIVPAGIIQPKVVPQGGAFDFNGDGTVSTSVPIDLDFLTDTNEDEKIDANDATPGDDLYGYDDWSNLIYSFDASLSKDFADGARYEDFLFFNSTGVGAGQLQFANAAYDVQERAGVATVTVVRAHGTDGAVSVQYRTIVAGSSAAAGADYTPVTGTLSFADGEYRRTFTVPLNNDAAFEGAETVSLQLLNPAGGAALGAVASSTLKITEPMVVYFVAPVLDASEAGGTLKIDVVLAGESGQTLSEDIIVSLADQLSGTAVAGVDYLMPGDVIFPAGSAVGTTRSFTLTLLDDFAADPTRSIQLSLAGIDSFAAVADSGGGLSVRVNDHATLNGFADAGNYNNFFREISDGAFAGPAAGGIVRYNRGAPGGSATALFDETPADGNATLTRFGGGSSIETYSLDFRAGAAGTGAGLYARIGGASSGGYHLSLRVENGVDSFVIWKNPSLTSPGSSDVSLFQHAAADFVSTGAWYTLVFTLQTNASGNVVTLGGRVFPQGETLGAPLAQFAAVDASVPVTAPGQTGFRFFDASGTGANVDMDNFTADASLDVQAGESVTLNESHFLTSLAVNGSATLASGGDKLLVTRAVAVTGRLDLRDNNLIVKSAPLGTWNGSAYTGVSGAIASSYNYGAWDGNGITTSMPDAGPTIGTTTLAITTADQILFIEPTETGVFAGEAVTGASVIVMYTYAGDLNFDGLVDAADYGVIDNFVQFPGTTGYANGDFNYDGVIDAGDYGIIDNTIQLQGPPLSPSTGASDKHPADVMLPFRYTYASDVGRTDADEEALIEAAFD